MVPKPLHPSKIKALPDSVGIEEGRGGARDRQPRAMSPWRWLVGGHDECGQHYYHRSSPLLLIWRIRHRLTGPQRGCSCSRCFYHSRHPRNRKVRAK